MNLVAEIGVPAGSPTVEVDGVRLAYARRGRGEPVVCLHAIGHGGRDFEAFAGLVSDQFEVICIDWPGQGRSGPDTQPASAARYAALLSGALTKLKIERPIVLGCSIGGAAQAPPSRFKVDTFSCGHASCWPRRASSSRVVTPRRARSRPY